MSTLDGLTLKDEPDTFGAGFHEEWIVGETLDGGTMALMVSFEEPQRIAIRYTRPDSAGGDVFVQSIDAEELLLMWVTKIEEQ